MTLLRRFLVIQMLMLWQGGFLFYAVFVVPAGTDVLGSALAQGRITRLVAGSMNVIGAIALLFFAWELWQGPARRRWIRNCLWVSWAFMAAGLIALFLLYPRLNELVDFDGSRHLDRGRFYWLHRVYLYISTAQWIASVVFAVVLLHSWRASDRQ
jgi:hypothetical protein